MTNAAKRIEVSPQVAAAIEEAARDGRRFVLVNERGLALATAQPTGISDELAARVQAANAKPEHELTEDDEDALDEFACLEFERNRANGDVELIPWEDVKASLGLDKAE